MKKLLVVLVIVLLVVLVTNNILVVDIFFNLSVEEVSLTPNIRVSLNIIGEVYKIV